MSSAIPPQSRTWKVLQRKVGKNEIILPTTGTYRRRYRYIPTTLPTHVPTTLTTLPVTRRPRYRRHTDSIPTTTYTYRPRYPYISTTLPTHTDDVTDRYRQHTDHIPTTLTTHRKHTDHVTDIYEENVENVTDHTSTSPVWQFFSCAVDHSTRVLFGVVAHRR